MNGETTGRGSIYIQNETLRRGFTSTPNRLLCNAALSMGARFVYTLLLSYAWQDDRCFPGQERLARDVGCSVRTVQRYLAELEDAGEIQVIQQGLQRPNIYVILDRRTEATPMSRQDTPALSHQDPTPLSAPATTLVSPTETPPLAPTDTSAVAHDKKGPTIRKHRDEDPTGGRAAPGSGERRLARRGRLARGAAGGPLSREQVAAPPATSRRAARALNTGGTAPTTAAPADHQEVASSVMVAQRLRAEGVSPAKARALATRYSPQQITQQIAWLDSRRYDDRPGCLVAAIEGDYGPPAAIARRERGRGAADHAAVAARSPDRYTGGAYGVCPVCLSLPCEPDCPVAER